MLQHWVKLEDILLSKIGQLQKDKYCTVLLKEGWLQGAEGGKNGKLFNGHRFSVLLERGGGDGCRTL